LHNAKGTVVKNQRVTKRYGLSWLTNSAFVYEPKCGVGRVAVCGVSANEYSCAQINLGDLTPNLTYASLNIAYSLRKAIGTF